jgi:hypothetical protein
MSAMASPLPWKNGRPHEPRYDLRVKAINDPGLNEIARKIVSEPGFSFDRPQLVRAMRQWAERTTREQRLAAEQALLIQWWQGLYAEHWQQQRNSSSIAAPGAGISSKVVAGEVVRDAPSPAGTAEPVSELKFRSESPAWQQPAPSLAAVADIPDVLEPVGVPVPSPTRTITDRASQPVTPARATSGLAATRPAPAIQQPSRKVEGYRNMFPELALSMQTASGPKPLWQCDEQDARGVADHLDRQRQMRRTEIAGKEASAEDLERRGAKLRAAAAELSHLNREDAALEEHLMRVIPELADRGGVIGDLPDDVLRACGFRRRVA